MRPLLLTAFALLLAGSSYAQYYEVGIGGGINTISTPTGLPDQYQGRDSKLNTVGQAIYNYNINDYWQVGGSVDMGVWQRKGPWAINGTLSTTDVNFVIADPAVAVELRGNRVIPFYSAINPEMVQTQIYFGLNAGLIFTANDGMTYNSPDGYVDQFDLQNGKGYIIGAQVGIAHYFKRHFGIFGEISPRYAHIKTSDSRDAHQFEKYHLFNLNITAGIRYRFGFYE